MKRVISILFHSVVLACTAFYLAWPLVNAGLYIQDPNLLRKQPPAIAVDLHKAISDDFTSWAEDRVRSRAGETLSVHNISGTEWPMFSAVYYLWATETLEQNWPNNSEPKPSVYAHDAIQAAADLIVSPSTAAWVRQHWGEDYLEKENLFYRMLLIAGLTAYQSITRDRRHEPLLKSQVTKLADELDQSEHGLLDDYPDQCYPIDIVPAIAVINRASLLLDIDMGNFVSRSKRGFIDTKLDPSTGLPAYVASSRTGLGIGPSRGVGASYMLVWSNEIWPELSRQWYKQYETHFIESTQWLAGVREFTRDYGEVSWVGDVDSGPIIWGKGIAASAFGLAAARTHGDEALAFGLSAQAVLASWPLPNGRLLLPQLLSDLTDAPYLGETALLFIFTRPMKAKQQSMNEYSLPRLVLLLMIALALVCIFVFQHSARRLISAIFRSA